MECILWGAGERGKGIFEFLLKNKIEVIAFIDSNFELVGNKFCDRVIINFQTYLSTYKNIFIIITPNNYYQIEEVLRENNIDQYFILSDCPAEMQISGNEVPVCLEEIKWDNLKDQNIIVYGLTLFGILVYSLFYRRNCSRIALVPHKAVRKSLITALQKADNYKYIKLKQVQDIKEDIDKILYTVEDEFVQLMEDRCKKKCINCFDLSDKISFYQNTRIHEFKNILREKRLFIVATGPSLLAEDLDKLYENHAICMSMNCIFKIFDKTKWRPQYYVCADKRVLHSYGDIIKNLAIKNKFIGDFYMPYWTDGGKGIQFHGHKEKAFFFNRLPKFSQDPSIKVYDGCTVTYFCMQFAAYMGVQEIILLGVDFYYDENLTTSNNHFYKVDTYEKEWKDEPNMKGQFLAYLKVAQYAKEHGIRIYNATRGGKLEIFPRVEFDSLF